MDNKQPETIREILKKYPTFKEQLEEINGIGILRSIVEQYSAQFTSDKDKRIEELENFLETRAVFQENTQEETESLKYKAEELEGKLETALTNCIIKENEIERLKKIIDDNNSVIENASNLQSQVSSLREVNEKLIYERDKAYEAKTNAVNEMVSTTEKLGGQIDAVKDLVNKYEHPSVVVEEIKKLLCYNELGLKDRCINEEYVKNGSACLCRNVCVYCKEN